MEAKDTVMSDKQVEELYGIKPHQLVPGVQIDELKLTQAEISFKAGMKKVALWITDNPDYFNSIDKWNAKLKEWGIE